MWLITTRDANNTLWYFKSAYVHYNWTEDISKAKKYKTEKAARNMIRKLWLNDRCLCHPLYVN